MFGFGIDFAELYSEQGLNKLECLFLRFCQEHELNVCCEDLLQCDVLKKALYLEQFLIRLFRIEQHLYGLLAANSIASESYWVKRNFVRKGLRSGRDLDFCVDPESVLRSIIGVSDLTEESYVNAVRKWINAKEENQSKLDIALQYARQKIQEESDWNVFNIPENLNEEKLIKLREEEGGILKSCRISPRYGFGLTDSENSTSAAVHNSHYCIHCHKHKKDSCRKGMYGPDGVVKSGITSSKLTGCPLDQKISEMHLLKSKGHDIAALSVIMMDNPMCLVTGRRICNDCVQSCIYQKQDPVDTPSTESNIVDNVLLLPYGFEIYSLLAKWNPLAGIIAKPYNGKRIMVVGMGPAGFYLSQQLLNDGCAVVGIDGLKIEPLIEKLAGNDFYPIRDIKPLIEDLAERKVYGFGGVAEYGITARWDKNRLKFIRILLERYQRFALIGSVALGCNLSPDQAFEIFKVDHIALASGAGKPNVLAIKNWGLNGIRMASDFLMSLHMNAPYRFDSVSDMQIAFPVVVIGGGLTALDAATEALAYYPVQVEKFYSRYEKLIKTIPKEYLFSSLSNEDRKLAELFIVHAEQIRNFKDDMKSLLEFLWGLGGVKLVYRKRLVDSPAYRLNHQELSKALEEGVTFVENLTPEEFIGESKIKQIKFRDSFGKLVFMNAKTVIVAIGTGANDLISQYGNVSNVSFWGDADPKYSGSVVKALASVKYGYRKLVNGIANSNTSFEPFIDRFIRLLSSRVEAVNRLTHSIVEVVIHSPMAARNFSPGQFYRLQSEHIEPIALTGASVYGDLISLVILEMGGSSSLCKDLVAGQSISLMGPSGCPSYIPSNKTVLLIGGGLGNAVLFSIGKAMKSKGCKVLYCAVYRNMEDRFKMAELEQAADSIIWGCDSGLLSANRDQDFSFQGNFLDVLEAYSRVEAPINFDMVEYLMVIGSVGMMKACAKAFQNHLKSSFPLLKQSFAALNSPMQCMMNGICARCVQKLRGSSAVVFACICQDYELESIDFDCLENRLSQDKVLENVTRFCVAAR